MLDSGRRPPLLYGVDSGGRPVRIILREDRARVPASVRTQQMYVVCVWYVSENV